MNELLFLLSISSHFIAFSSPSTITPRESLELDSWMGAPWPSECEFHSFPIYTLGDYLLSELLTWGLEVSLFFFLIITFIHHFLTVNSCNWNNVVRKYVGHSPCSQSIFYNFFYLRLAGFIEAGEPISLFWRFKLRLTRRLLRVSMLNRENNGCHLALLASFPVRSSFFSTKI